MTRSTMQHVQKMKKSMMRNHYVAKLKEYNDLAAAIRRRLGNVIKRGKGRQMTASDLAALRRCRQEMGELIELEKVLDAMEEASEATEQ
jgi:hypothetical protein